MRLVLIRHGLSLANAEGRMQGWLDSPLSDAGREQALALTRRLVREGWRIRAIYSSDLLRAAQTADLLGTALGLPVVLDRRLREYDIGAISGAIWSEMEFSHPEIWLSLQGRGERVPIPGEEGMPAFYERVSAALADILGRHASGAEDDAVALVTHGGTLRMMLANFLQLDPTRRVPFEFHNASLTVVRLDPRPTLVRHNDACHLDGYHSS
jgi:broad specificity phosphatase PhoE